MNRREAIAALVSIPGLARIERADLKPSDVLVFSVDAVVSESSIKRILAQAKEIWPDHKAIVLGDGLTLKVVSPSDGR